MFFDLVFSLIVWNFISHFGCKGTKNMFQTASLKQKKIKTTLYLHIFSRRDGRTNTYK